VWPVTGLQPGTYTLRLLVALPDSPQQETRLRVVVDPTSLAVRLVQPVPGTTIREGNILTLSAEASGPAARVELLVDDQVAGSEPGTLASISWVAAGIGQHTIVAEVVGEDGTRARSQPIVLEVLH
jgi:hypothetical protein